MTDKENEKIDVRKQNKKDDPKSTDKEDVFDHNEKNADYKNADWCLTSVYALLKV